MKCILCLHLAAVCLTLALAGPALAKRHVPIKGTIEALEESVAVFPPEVPFPTLFVEASGSGRATGLGRFTVTYELEVNLDTFVGVGTASFAAANGDSLFTDVEGEGTVPTDDGLSVILETQTITGGTGRFAGARGRFTVVRLINVFTGETSGLLGGIIVLD
jgi:hypothetical protein